MEYGKLTTAKLAQMTHTAWRAYAGIVLSMPVKAWKDLEEEERRAAENSIDWIIRNPECTDSGLLEHWTTLANGVKWQAGTKVRAAVWIAVVRGFLESHT